ncbi:ribonuclease H-like domain-containing protein [Tanacetum coccineum]
MTPTSSLSYDFLDDSSYIISHLIRLSPTPNNTTQDAPLQTTNIEPTALSTPTVTTENDGTPQPASVFVSQLQSTPNVNLNPTSVHPMVTHTNIVRGVDVDETFSPVVKPGTIQTVLSLDVSRDWPVHQLDVKNAFLHGDLSETVYMHQPSGFRDSAYPDHVCLLQRSFYGLKQASRAWFQRFAAYISRRIIAFLHQEFSMTDLGSLNYFLGISVTRNSSGMFLSQRKYATEILERAHMLGCNSIRTPVDTESKPGADGDPVSNPTLYRSLAGSLQYLTFTRPYISYAVQQVCLYMHDLREPYFLALKRILRYVHGSLDYELQLFSSSTTSLVAYSDADWAGFPTTRRSTFGYCVFLGNNLLSWSFKRQPTLSSSSAEAKYRVVANAIAETCWLRNLLRELHTPVFSATLVYYDNVSAVYLSSILVQHQRTKYIEIDIHFVRDLVAAGQVRVSHVSSRYHTFIAPSRTALPLFSWMIHKLKIAEAASFIALRLKDHREALKLPLYQLVIYWNPDNEKRVAAALLLVSCVRDLSASKKIEITIGVFATSFLLFL